MLGEYLGLSEYSVKTGKFVITDWEKIHRNPNSGPAAPLLHVFWDDLWCMYTHNVAPLQTNILGIFIQDAELGKKNPLFKVTKNCFQKLIHATNVLSLVELDSIYKRKFNKM